VNVLPLLQVQATAPSGFERTVAVIADVATIVIALAIIVAGAVAIYGALKARAAIRRARTDLHPAIRSLTTAAGHAEAMSRTVREQVDEVSATVRATNEKVRRATDAAEARLLEVNALLGVVQAEAEEAFVKTAAAVRGVQAASRALRAPEVAVELGMEDEGMEDDHDGRDRRDIFG
jgi:hypothetical protein